MQVLREEAGRHGIAYDRLIWAGRTDSHAAHVARHARADLFLDTFPYAGHASSAAALSAGLPVLTRRGGSYVSRVGASFLHTLGLDELSTDGIAAYEAAALALVADPARLAALRAKLIAARAGNPFFDGALFARHIEAAYTQMYAIARAGEPPRPITVQP
jgi:predicted O-linked N-acetylglucosamine transferase (SPINDLY family)